MECKLPGCRNSLLGMKSTAKFCCEPHRKRYWEKFGPKFVCRDCGTMITRKASTGRCRSCALFNHHGTGRDF